MAKNYISENIEYLIQKSKTSQDEFGALFDLNRGVVGQYIRRGTIPKIDTIQNICSHFKILIDDFVNRELTEDIINQVNESQSNYGKNDAKYVTMLESVIIDKNKIIDGLEFRLKQFEAKPNKKNAG